MKWLGLTVPSVLTTNKLLLGDKKIAFASTPGAPSIDLLTVKVWYTSPPPNSAGRFAVNCTLKVVSFISVHAVGAEIVYVPSPSVQFPLLAEQSTLLVEVRSSQDPSLIITDIPLVSVYSPVYITPFPTVTSVPPW